MIELEALNWSFQLLFYIYPSSVVVLWKFRRFQIKNFDVQSYNTGCRQSTVLRTNHRLAYRNVLAAVGWYSLLENNFRRVLLRIDAKSKYNTIFFRNYIDNAEICNIIVVWCITTMNNYEFLEKLGFSSNEAKVLRRKTGIYKTRAGSSNLALPAQSLS